MEKMEVSEVMGVPGVFPNRPGQIHDQTSLVIETTMVTTGDPPL